MAILFYNVFYNVYILWTPLLRKNGVLSLYGIIHAEKLNVQRGLWSIKNQDLSKKFLKGAFILTLSSVFIKILSALYRIPYQNIVGDVGFYIYQQVYPFYSLILALGTYGFPVVIAKLLAEADEKNSRFTRTEVITASWATLGCFSLLLFLWLFSYAGTIAGFMNDERLEDSIKLVSFTFLYLPVLSIAKGSFQSGGEMRPTAVSQVIDQTIRVGFILVSCYSFYRFGLSPYEAAEGAYKGSIAGGLAGCIVLAAYWLRFRRRRPIRFSGIRVKKFLPLVKKIMGQGIVFAISSLVLVFIQFLDALFLYPLLTDSGHGVLEAKQLKGVFDRGQPLIQMATAAIISISLTMVPLVSKFNLERNMEMVRYYTELAFRLSLMLGLPAALGLFWLMEPVNIALFTDANGSAALRILVLSILFGSLVMTGMFVLQSLNRSWISCVIIGIGLAVKCCLMLLLVPEFSIIGAAISTTAAFAVMNILLFAAIRRVFGKSVIRRKTVYLTFFAAGCMSIMLGAGLFAFRFLGKHIESGRLMSWAEVLAMVSAGAVLYIVIIIRKGLFTLEEIEMLPMGSKIKRILPNK